ncbi:MAG: hypothetical protein IPO00_17685 [Betaproteobacteria bacterium]|nr:hypothetical protein [Betaproteobacteria bacterium]
MAVITGLVMAMVRPDCLLLVSVVVRLVSRASNDVDLLGRDVDVALHGNDITADLPVFLSGKRRHCPRHCRPCSWRQ